MAGSSSGDGREQERSSLHHGSDLGGSDGGVRNGDYRFAEHGVSKPFAAVKWRVRACPAPGLLHSLSCRGRDVFLQLLRCPL